MADTRDAQADPVTLLVEDVARKLPKVELHLHLDGSLCEEFIVPRLAALGLASPLAATETGGAFTSLNEWALQVKRRPELLTDDMIAHKGQSGNEKMNLFNWANQFLQTADDLYEATKGLCDSLRASHNVVYAEVRFCPTLHTLNGLSELQATNAAIEGFKASGMPGGIIICALRTMPEPHWHDMATLAYVGRAKVHLRARERAALALFCERTSRPAPGLAAARCSRPPLRLILSVFRIETAAIGFDVAG